MCERGTICQRKMKGVSFLSNMIYKKVRGWASGRSLSVCGNFAEYPARHKPVSMVQDSRFNRTKQSLFDLNVFINIKLIFSTTTVILSVFTLSFLFFRQGSSCFNLSEYTNLFLSLPPCCGTPCPQK